MTDEKCSCGKKRYLCWRHALQDAKRRKREAKSVRGLGPYRDPGCRQIHLGKKTDHMQRRYERKAA